MARLGRTAVIGAALALLAKAALAAPSPAGAWEIISDADGKPRALIELTVVGGQLQGVLTKSLRGEDPNKLCAPCKGDEHNKRIVGMRVLWGLKPAPGDPLTWQGGQILDPDSGNVYSAKVSESADGKTLTVRGFIGISLIGRTQTWRRAG
ncbi:MAG TPA: DUF2147 domain-containing protein [Caulobacteraceae bacterium]|nr:DUF2147 domain-containing protein [Caulobacteraceae bacterium]